MERALTIDLAPSAGERDEGAADEHATAHRLTYRIIKRGLDICFSLAAVLVLSPLIALVAVVVKLSSEGPVLHPWVVVGRGGRVFRGYKFRTMYVDAEKRRAELLHLNEMTGPVFKIRADPRITRAGRHLRKWSLDELPQLWSVLVGDMSLVGPRPGFPHEWELYTPSQRKRLSVTPGITCLWQVSGRNQINNFDDWVKLDLDYIENWSLALDFGIMARTVATVLKGTGR